VFEEVEKCDLHIPLYIQHLVSFRPKGWWQSVIFARQRRPPRAGLTRRNSRFRAAEEEWGGRRNRQEAGGRPESLFFSFTRFPYFHQTPGRGQSLQSLASRKRPVFPGGTNRLPVSRLARVKTGSTTPAPGTEAVVCGGGFFVVPWNSRNPAGIPRLG